MQVKPSAAMRLFVVAIFAVGITVSVAYAAQAARPHHHGDGHHVNDTTTTTTTSTTTATTTTTTTPTTTNQTTATSQSLGSSTALTTGTVTVGGSWSCSGAVNITLLTVQNNGSGDAVKLRAGCTGTIGRIVVTGVRNGDGIKVQGGVHDLTIGGGIVACAGPSTDGTHQDGTQVMGGTNITFNRVVFDCYGPAGGGNFFVQQAGSGGKPTSVVCVHCALGPHRSRTHNLNLGPSVSSGARDTLICKSGASAFYASGATSPVNVNNILAPSGDARCSSTTTLQAWTG